MGVLPEQVWRCRDKVLKIGARPLVMGILNATPDSFSDGGRYAGREAAIKRGFEMISEGADIIDVGGESTRPGAATVPAVVEVERVVPVIKALAEAVASGGTVISVDTRKAAVAEAALEAGASIVNDVTAFEGDPAMAGVARRYRAGVVLMHMRGEPGTMQRDPRYKDVVNEVTDYLAARMAVLKRAGFDDASLALDPGMGIGFGKTPDHNVQLVAGLETMARLERPIVLGVSRKNFIGKITGREVEDRMAGSLACAVWASSRGARVWRVHDVRESVDAARMVASLNKETTAWSG